MATRKKESGNAPRHPRPAAVRVEKVLFVTEADQDADPNDYLFQDPDYREEDQERLDAYNRGDWQFVGVYAEARVIVSGTLQTVRTAGLWGIESDSGRDYFEETARNEYDELVGILAQLGVQESRIPPADRAEWVEGR